MRILHISPHYYPVPDGGGDIHIQRISEELARRGHDVTVVTTTGSIFEPTPVKELKAAETVNLVKVLRFRPEGRMLRAFQAFLRMPGSWRLLSTLTSPDLVRMLHQGPWNFRSIVGALCANADLVTTINWQYGALALQGSLIKRIKRRPLVAIPLFHTEEPWSRSPLFPTMLAECDAVLANTDHEKRFIEARTPCPGAVLVVGAGIDPALFSEPDGARIRREYGIESSPVVGYVGRLQPIKGVVKLIEAMMMIWRSDPDVRLLLAGRRLPPDTRPDRELAQALAQLSPSERSRIIHIDGFKDKEKASIFDAMDVFAMPSVAESFGITYLEAWICRKPVIGAHIGSTQCVIRDGVDGLIVDPNDPEAIARAIRELLDDPVRRKSMGESGYAKTISQFTWEKITDKVERIYQDLLAGERRKTRDIAR